MKTKLKKSQRAPKVYNKLPIKVTRKEFNDKIKKHLTKGSRGVKPTLSRFDIFNHILYVLHTGIPWYTLPVKKVHWTNVYKHHNKWSKDGSYEKVFNGSLDWLSKEEKLDLSALHCDGSNVVAKKGARK
jgi:transposase